MATLRIDGKPVKIRHMRPRASGWYFVPSAAMKRAGYASEPLGKDPIKAAARAQELNQEWDRARTAPARVTAAHGSLAWLYEEYHASSWYADLSQSTKDDVERCARTILSSPLGKMEAAKIGRKDVRRFYDKVFAAKSLEPANKHVKVLRRILNFGRELELLITNPAERLNIKHGKPRDQTWTEEQVRVFIAKAREMNKPGWAIAVSLGYDTAQRLSDVMSATHSQIEDGGITFKQQKTGKRVWTPLDASTLSLIADTPKKAVTLVYGDRGQPITQRAYFNRVFRAIKVAAGLPEELRFHDLRRTAATEVLAGGGRAEPLTGHQPGSNVLKVYEVPNRQAARSAQEARKRGREKS